MKQAWPVGDGAAHVCDVNEIEWAGFGKHPVFFGVVDEEVKVRWDPKRGVI